MLSVQVEKHYQQHTLHTPDFALLMQYRNEDVLHKFRDAWDVTAEEANDIFTEMKKYLYVASIGQQECFNVDIEEPTLIIDEMWHTFILFTKEYEKFCSTYFGAMLHHMPYSKTELKNAIAEATKAGLTFNEGKERRLRYQLELISRTLGKETIVKWYGDYANRYSKEKINIMRRQVFHLDEVYAQVTCNAEELAGKSLEEIKDIVAGTYAVSGFCGSSCGMYSTCNSNIGMCPI